MNGFLTQVATDLWTRYGTDVERLTMVFPSRRARLFFGDALSGIIDCPMWQPDDIQIDTLAEELSGLQNGERLRLVVELWKVYSEFHPSETFDDFYFWGELLIGDFDAVDKYLIDADILFSNLVDLHALDARFEYFSEEQRAIVENFWGTFSTQKGTSKNYEKHSQEQIDFLRIWRTLAPVYHRFRARLKELGIGYQGMVYREAAERITAGNAPQLPERQYVVAGFNALSRSEQVIFEHLKKSAKTDFYWDWDEYFLQRAEQESAMFMRDNLRRFPPASRLGGGNANFVKPKRIRSISTASDVLQCKWAGERLRELSRTSKTDESHPKALGKETVIVLCDETLLAPLLWSLPDEAERVNVTMGYPLRLHTAYTFVERLVELQARKKVSKNGSAVFYHSDVDGLISHPYLIKAEKREQKSKYVYVSAEKLKIASLLEHIFSTPDDWRKISDYLTVTIGKVAEKHPETEEVFTLIADHIRALKEALERCEIEPKPKTYTTLLRRSLQNVTLPFEGEPLEGVQVMGILETRALDFENLIFLSSGDATMPGNLGGAPSFIPYSLKMAYGLPTPEHHEGVWAYHFFRLLQRADNVELVWSRTTDDRGSGEPSRYILQLDYESPHYVEHQDLTIDVTLPPTEAITVEKEVEKIPQRISPSLFWTWMECRLKFYFRAVAHLRADDEVSEEVDGALFGNLLHSAMHRLYAPLIGVQNVREKIAALIGSPEVDGAIKAAVEELSPLEDGGAMLLTSNTIVQYINNHILPFDAARSDDFTIDNLEHWVEKELGRVTFFGKADRIDRLADGTLKVIDYKTGSPTGAAREAAIFQVRMYSWMIGSSEKNEAQAELYYVRDTANTVNVVDSAINIEDDLQSALTDIFDPSQPFVQTDDIKRCEYCDFAKICRRI